MGYQDFFTLWKDADPDIPMLPGGWGIVCLKEFGTSGRGRLSISPLISLSRLYTGESPEKVWKSVLFLVAFSL
jgi:hypothetical protein